MLVTEFFTGVEIGEAVIDDGVTTRGCQPARCGRRPPTATSPGNLWSAGELPLIDAPSRCGPRRGGRRWTAT
jgi:hypothetical protein